MVLGGRRSPLRALRRSCKKRKTRDHSLLVSAKAEFLLVTVLSCSPCLAAGTKVHLGNFFKWLEYLYLFELFEKTWLTTLLFCHLQLLLSLISSITCFINMSFQDKSVIPRLQRRVFAQEPLNRPPDKTSPNEKNKTKKSHDVWVFSLQQIFLLSPFDLIILPPLTLPASGVSEGGLTVIPFHKLSIKPFSACKIMHFSV